VAMLLLCSQPKISQINNLLRKCQLAKYWLVLSFKTQIAMKNIKLKILLQWLIYLPFLLPLTISMGVLVGMTESIQKLFRNMAKDIHCETSKRLKIRQQLSQDTKY
jgi:hypothetical protein